MNYSFRGAFNNFSRSSKSKFGQSSFNFSKSFFSNKFNMNFSDSSTNQSNTFKINFGNKYFMSKLQCLSLSQTIAGMITNSCIVSGLSQGSMQNESDSEMESAAAIPNDTIVLLGDICLIRDDCKWTCSTRLTSGPQSPVNKMTIR